MASRYPNPDDDRKRGAAQPALLVSHHWAGELAEKLWRCIPRAAILRGIGLDPVCTGCRLEVRYEDVPRLARYRGPSMAGSTGQEALAWQLDLIAAAAAVHERERFFAEGRGRQFHAS